MQEQPPKWAVRFLEKTCSPSYLDELEGDLLELFYRDVDQLGVQKAKKRFIWKALLSPRWHRLPKLGQIQVSIMYRSHFKVAFRHAVRHKSATAIHALGLILGLFAVFYIGLFVKNELLYDTMHDNGENLYRVLRADPLTGERNHGTSSRHGAVLAEEFPFISMCRFGNDPVKMGEVRPLLVDDFFWADSTFFELFSFPFLHGDPATCLDEVNSLVITESLSRQLFSTENSLGRTMKVKVYDGDQEYLMQITGVVKDPPRHTHIQFKALGSMANAEDLYQSLVRQWGFSWVRTYIQVPRQRMKEIEDSVPDLISELFGEDPPPNFGIAFQAFKDVYLHSQDVSNNTFRGDVRNLKIFGAIGGLILLISLMNYVNLATARAVTRSKEVGVRKVLGSNKFGVVSQFIVESVFFTLSGGLIAYLLMLLCLPRLNALLDLDLSVKILSWSEGVFIVLGLILLGILAGLIPSLVMSKIPILSDAQSAIQFRVGQWSSTRKLFVGAQYFITLILLVSAFVIYKQYLYLKNFDLGFDSNQLLHLAVDDRALQQRMGLLKERVGEIAGVVGVTATGEDLPSKLNNTWNLDWNGADLEKPLGIDIIGVDKAYFDMLGIKFKVGRNFIHDFQVDSARTVIINEQAQKIIGLDDILDRQLIIGGQNRQVIGVVEDHHNTSLHTQILPLAYFIFPPGFRVSPDNLLIKLETKNLSGVLKQLEEVWGEFSTDPFKYNFVDEAFASAYKAERRFSTLIGSFTLIAVSISLVGLFGLINFIVQLKMKEISIRRVLGAGQFHLLHLLGRDFLLVFGVALILALPLAYYFIDSWLSAYAYRIQVDSFLMFLAVFLCLGVSVLVIFYHLQRAKRINPAEVLSAE